MKNLILLPSLMVALLTTATGQTADTAKDKQPTAATANTSAQTPRPADIPATETGAKAADNQPASPPAQQPQTPKDPSPQSQDQAAKRGGTAQHETNPRCRTKVAKLLMGHA